MIVTTKRSARAFAVLALGIASCLQGTVQSAPQRIDAGAALVNPNHKLWSEHSPDVCRVRLETSKGNIVVEIHRDWAPLGADRFYNLARAGFFDDSRFFRVRAGFIAQFGIPGNPTIASVWKEKAIADDPVRHSNIRGSIAYAMTGPNTRTTQLYFNLSDNARLDAEGFAPIAQVVEGMENVDRLYAGYGEEAGGGMRGGKQAKIFEGGNQYLDHGFPALDRLSRVSIVNPAK